MRSHNKRGGAILVMVAVSLIMVLGVVAISLDGSLLIDKRRHVQTAADAAAMAGAADLYTKYDLYEGADTLGTAIKSAFELAASNGFTNDSTHSVVTVSVYPDVYKDGPSAGKAIPKGYVEVQIQFNQARGISSIFGSGKLPVRARAVARGRKTGAGIGILALNPTASGALTVSGNYSFTVEGGVYVNSSSSTAAIGNGNVVLEADRLAMGGGYKLSGGAVFDATTISTNQDAYPDFLADVPPPDPSTLAIQSESKYTTKSTVTLHPGIYVGGIALNAEANVTLSPGIYYMKGGGLSTTGMANLTGEGVIIYNDYGSNGQIGTIDLAGTGTVKLTPPTSGIYQGISIFQNRTATAPVKITGTSTWDIQGVIYAKSASLEVGGTASATLGSQLVADTVKLFGNGSFQVINSDAGHMVRDFRLVE